MCNISPLLFSSFSSEVATVDPLAASKPRPPRPFPLTPSRFPSSFTASINRPPGLLGRSLDLFASVTSSSAPPCHRLSTVHGRRPPLHLLFPWIPFMPQGGRPTLDGRKQKAVAVVSDFSRSCRTSPRSWLRAR